MVTAQELCLRLGFTEKVVGACSRGEPNTLLSDIRDFAAKLTGNSDPAWTTYRYLHAQGRGPAQWPKIEDAESAQLLRWPRDAELITDLVKQLFTLQINSLTESAQATSGPPEAKLDHVHTESQEMADTSRPLSTINSASNRVRLNEPKQAGQSEALITSSNGLKPLFAGSGKELAKTIEAWIGDHHGERPPASLVYRKSDIKEHIVKEVRLTIGSGPGWVRRFQINNQWMAWMIEDKDGRCMLAKPAMNHCNNGFRAWLGGDRGFTPAAIAHLSKPANRTKIVGSELIDSEDDGSERDDVNTASSPQLQSLPRIKRARVPIDYTVPAFLSPSTRSPNNVRQQPRPIKRRKVARRSDIARSISPSVVSISAGTSASRPSRTVKRETAASSVSSHDPVVVMHDLVRSSSTESSADSITATTSAGLPATSSKIASNITFHFFLSDADLGAVPKDFVDCNTFNSFFNQALAAWKILGGEDRNTIMTAVSVVLVSVDWPIVIPWRNKDGFEMMMGIVTKAAVGRREHLDVKVKCMRKA